MRKILYATAAVVGASMLAQGATAAISVSGQYRGAYLFHSGDEKRKDGYVGTDGALRGATKSEQFGANDRESAYKDVTRLTFTGSKDHPTGLESGFYMQFRGEESSASTGTSGGDTVANAYGYVSGAFGRVRAGDYAPAGYGTGYAVATPFTANFGADDCNYSPAQGADWCGTTMLTAYLAGYRNKQIGYTSPSFSGFQVEVTYAPDSGKGVNGGQINSVSEPGGLDQVFSVGMAYSNSVGGADVSIGAGFASATYEAGEDQRLRGTVAGTTGDAAKPVVTSIVDTNLGTDANRAAMNAAANETMNPSIKDPGDDPSAFNLGIVVGIDDLSFGGSYGKYDRADGTETTAFSAGGSYNLDALTFGLGWRQSETTKFERVREYVAGTTLRDTDTAPTALPVSTSKVVRDNLKDTEYSVVAFTVDYSIGDGAAVDFVIEQSTTEGQRSVSTVDGTNDADRTSFDYSDTGFGIGLNLTF